MTSQVHTYILSSSITISTEIVAILVVFFVRKIYGKSRVIVVATFDFRSKLLHTRCTVVGVVVVCLYIMERNIYPIHMFLFFGVFMFIVMADDEIKIIVFWVALELRVSYVWWLGKHAFAPCAAQIMLSLQKMLCNFLLPAVTFP